MNKSFVIIFIVITAVIAILVFLFYGEHNIINKNKFYLNEGEIFLQGNATVNIFKGDSNKVHYLIDDTTRNTFFIENLNDSVLLYQRRKTNIYIRLFDRNNDYPVINVFIPKTTRSFNFNLVGNGDIIFRNSFDFNKAVFSLIGNGDIISKVDLRISNCVLDLTGNGDMKFSNVQGDTLKYKISGNGSINAKGQFIFMNEIK